MKGGRMAWTRRPPALESTTTNTVVQGTTSFKLELDASPLAWRPRGSCQIRRAAACASCALVFHCLRFLLPVNRNALPARLFDVQQPWIFGKTI